MGKVCNFGEVKRNFQRIKETKERKKKKQRKEKSKR